MCLLWNLRRFTFKTAEFDLGSGLVKWVHSKEYLTGELNLLADKEEEALKALANEQALQEKYIKLQQRIAEFHQQCQAWREKLANPQFLPSYKFKRDACEFFGITVIAYRHGHTPPFDTEARPPSIVSLLSR